MTNGPTGINFVTKNRVYYAKHVSGLILRDPGGVGVVPWMVPGGADIAMATSELMKKYDAAVWAHHGLFVSGPDYDITFGLMHTIEKAAQIYMLAITAGGGKIRQTITDDNLRAIAKEFGVELNEEFLN